MEENKYCVYMHTCIINNKKYIGITSNISCRWGASGKNYKSQYFYRAINKHGWDNFKHEILLDNLTLEEAKLIEIEMIKKYKTTNKQFGYNISSGGDCRNKHTNESKEKMRLVRIGRFKGENSPRFGVKHSTETREKIKEALKNVDWDYIKEKISESNSKKVVQLSKSGEFIKTWDSITDASNNFDISQNTIIRCCKHISKNVNKFVWMYEDEYIDLTTKEINKIINNCTVTKNSIKIVQLGIDGKFISEWSSISTACISLFSGNRSANVGICACCKGKLKTSFGYKWMYFSEYENMSKEDIQNKINKDKIIQNSISILQFSLDGIFMKEFNSTSQIEEDLGFKKHNINNACRIGSKSSYGFIWIRKTDYDNNNKILTEKVNMKRKNIPIVVQLTLDGDFVKEWYGMSEAKKEGFSDDGIYNCCRQKISKHSGYIWMYLEDYKNKTKEQIIDIYKNIYSVKKVVQLNKKGELVKIWGSTSEACKEEFISSKICDCCNKKRKTHKGFIWMYYDDYYKLVDNFVVDNGAEV